MEMYDLTYLNVGLRSRDIKHHDSYIYHQGQRNIFNMVNLKPNEVTALRALEDNDLPQSQKLRLLYAANFDLELAHQMMKEYYEFMNQQANLAKDKEIGIIEEILKSGFIYMYGKDPLFRPIIWVSLQVGMNKQWTLSQIMKTLSVLLYCTKSQVLQDYYVEQWLVVIDLESASMNMALLLQEQTQHLLHRLAVMFSGHLYKMLVVNAKSDDFTNFVSNLELINSTLSKKLVYIVDGPDLLRFIPESQLQKRFHGTADNLTRYWYNQNKEFRPPKLSFSRHRNQTKVTLPMKASINSDRNTITQSLHKSSDNNPKKQASRISSFPLDQSSVNRSSMFRICVIEEGGKQILEEDIEVHDLQDDDDDLASDIPLIDAFIQEKDQTQVMQGLDGLSSDGEDSNDVFDENGQHPEVNSKEKKYSHSQISILVGKGSEFSPRSIVDLKTLPYTTLVMKTSKTIHQPIQIEGENKQQAEGCCSGSCMIF